MEEKAQLMAVIKQNQQQVLKKICVIVTLRCTFIAFSIFAVTSQKCCRSTLFLESLCCNALLESLSCHKKCHTQISDIQLPHAQECNLLLCMTVFARSSFFNCCFQNVEEPLKFTFCGLCASFNGCVCLPPEMCHNPRAEAGHNPEVTSCFSGSIVCVSTTYLWVFLRAVSSRLGDLQLAVFSLKD